MTHSIKRIETEYFYNEELKNRYIQSKEESVFNVNYIEFQFRKSAEIEEKLGKDICNWTIYEIIDFYKMLNLTSFDSLYCINNIFVNYTSFCLYNNLVKDNQNHFLECTIDLLMTCLNKSVFDRKIVTRDMILNWVYQLPNPKDQFILLGLFEFGKSVGFKDLINARPKDLDIENKKLKLIDRTVSVSNLMITVIEGCVEEDKYYSISGKGAKTMPLIDYGYIIKGYPNQSVNSSERQKGRNIYMAAQRIFDYLGVGRYMTTGAIADSGKLHMIKERSKELNITPVEYIYSIDFKEVEQQFNCKIAKNVFYKKFSEYLE